MKKQISILVGALCLMLLAVAPPALAESRIGVGANYWRTWERIQENIEQSDVDEDGYSLLVSYQYVPIMFLRLEADVEVFPDNFTGVTGQTILAPQGFVIAALGPLYAGLGVGIYYANEAWAAAPFYIARVGYEFELLPHIFVDLNVNYRIEDWAKIEKIPDNQEDLNTDTLRLGAAVRLGF